MAGELEIFSNPVYDYEFLGFSFDGQHSSEFGLTVVSSSGQSQDEIFSSFEDKIVEVSGRDGAYYFGTTVKSKQHTIELAYDYLTSKNYRKIKQWLNPKTVAKLIFDERPYKYYWAKVSASPTFSYVPFEEEIETEKTHIFKGTFTITFISFDPYSYSDTSFLDEVIVYNPDDSNYKPYIHGNFPGWYGESGLFDTNAANMVGAGNSSFSSVAIGGIQFGGTNASFYNCGTVDSYPTISFSIANFTSSYVYTLKNEITNQTFQINSLFDIPTVSTNATLKAVALWNIACNPSKGMITANLNGTTLNIGSVHNGEFLAFEPGDNKLITNMAIGNLAINFKNVYW